MSKSIPDNALIVVADGGKAVLFRQSGTGAVSLKEVRHITPKALVDENPSGARPEEQSPKQAGEAGFANSLAHTLHTMLQHKEYSDLVVVADPTTLGELRGAMHKTVESAVLFSLSKDLTNSPVKDIEAALSK